MIKKLTNRTLAIVLIIVMFLSVFGALMSLNRIEGVANLLALTGAWEVSGATNSTYGAVNLTITSLLRINFTIDNASFGSGYVKSGASACVLSTGETAEDTTGCSDFNSPGSVHGLLLENIGNKYAMVNLSNNNWSSSLMGGTDPGYAWKWVNVSDDANITCGYYNTFYDEFESFVNLTSTNYPGKDGAGIGKVLCTEFNYTDGSNDINITFKLHIPQNAPARDLEDTWFAFATAA